MFYFIKKPLGFSAKIQKLKSHGNELKMYEGKGNWTPFKTKLHIFGVGTWRTSRERSLTYSWNYGGSKAPFFKVFLRAGDLKKSSDVQKTSECVRNIGKWKGESWAYQGLQAFFIRLIKSSLFLASKRFSTPISRRRWKRTVRAWITHKRASWAGILQTGGGNLPLLPFTI